MRLINGLEANVEKLNILSREWASTVSYWNIQIWYIKYSGSTAFNVCPSFYVAFGTFCTASEIKLRIGRQTACLSRNQVEEGQTDVIPSRMHTASYVKRRTDVKYGGSAACSSKFLFV